MDNDQRAHLLPLGIQELPDLRAFDTVFSMGVLYHRKSPIEHIEQLRNQLKDDGELVLETLVVDGDENQVLMPSDRYGKMRNVWFLPSSAALTLGRALRVHRGAHRRREYDQHRRTASYRLDD